MKASEGVADLCQLNRLGETDVLQNLKLRYARQKIYTSVTARVLIAVNPYAEIQNSQSEDTMHKYQQEKIHQEGLLGSNNLSPHTFTVANSAFHNVTSTEKNQSIIVCGESGSGKTESAKLIMRFLAYTTTSSSCQSGQFKAAQSIGKQILDANPILESFGNAQTLLNDNSSRFGKFTKMLFHKDADKSTLVGAAIETYLLEKSRVVTQERNERNYHVFYYLCAKAREFPEFELAGGDCSKFRYLNASEDARPPGDEAKFLELQKAFKTINVPEEDQKKVFGTVAALLHLGNVEFDVKASDNVSIKPGPAVSTVARLLQIDESQLVTRLTTRSINVNHSVITKPLNLNEATANRDSVAKALYCGLFNWIVDRLNKESNPSSNLKCKWIGILDVFGFEIFEQNSFEQFCINYANERLQAYFNFHVLKSEQDLYRREALLWTPVDLPDNSDCIELIDGKMTGIFPVLDSANVQPQGTDKIFTQNLFKARLNHRRMERVTRDPKRRQRGQRLEQYNGFRIQHYAGAVIYDAKEFLVKNADTAHPNTSVLMSQSKCSLVSQLLQSTKPQGRRGSMAFVSVSNTFRRQLGSLMSTLEQTNPYFVRCVKPNSHKKPGSFLPEYVLPQLRYGGVVEALRIIKCGFPIRCSYKRIYERFGGILQGYATPVLVNKRDFAQAMICLCGGSTMGSETLERSEYQLGLTMIFLRPGKQAFLDQILSRSMEEVASLVEDIRHFLVIKRIVRMRGAVKSYLRLKHFLTLRRFQRAANTMRIIHKTMFRSLRRARQKIYHRKHADEERKLASDAKYQAALKQAEELTSKEKQWSIKLTAEKNAVKRAKEAEDEALEQMRTLMNKMQKLEQQTAKAKQAAASAIKNSESKLEEEMMHAKSLLSQKESALKEAQEKARVEAEKCSAAERQMDLLQRELQGAAQQSQTLRGDWEKSRESLQSLQSKLETEQQERLQAAQHLQQELQDQAEQREAAQAAAQRAEDDKGKMSRKLEQITAEQSNLKRQAAELREELEALRGRSSTEQHEAHLRLDEVARERDRFREEAQRKEERSRGQQRDLEVRLEAAREELRVEKAKPPVKAGIPEEEFVRHMRLKDDALEEANAELKLLASRLAETNEQVSASEESVRETESFWKAQMHERDAQLDSTQSQLSVAEDRADDLVKEREEEAENHSRTRSLLEAARASTERDASALRAIRGEADRLQRELSEAQNRENDERHLMQDKEAKWMQQLGQLTADHSLCLDKLRSSEQGLSDARQKENDLLRKARTLRDENAALRREIKYREKARRDSELIMLKQIQDQQEAVNKVNSHMVRFRQQEEERFAAQWETKPLAKENLMNSPPQPQAELMLSPSISREKTTTAEMLSPPGTSKTRIRPQTTHTNRTTSRLVLPLSPR